MANKNYLDKSGLSYFWGKIKSALNGKVNTSDLSTVATSGSYNDLSNKPSIPTKTSDLTNDSGFVTSEVSVSTTQPSGDEDLWINPNESVNVYGNYISNTYGTSTEIGYSQNYSNNCNTYSTTETDTGKTWIDGKKIYRKCVSLSSWTSSTTTVAHNISGIGAVIDVYGYFTRSDVSNKWLPIIKLETSSQWASAWSFGVEGVDTTNISFSVGSSIGSVINGGYVILEYTKSS